MRRKLPNLCADVTNRQRAEYCLRHLGILKWEDDWEVTQSHSGSYAGKVTPFLEGKDSDVSVFFGYTLQNASFPHPPRAPVLAQTQLSSAFYSLLWCISGTFFVFFDQSPFKPQ